MNLRTLGLVATIVAAALGAWWCMTQRGRSRGARGTVIYDDTFTADDADAII